MYRVNPDPMKREVPQAVLIKEMRTALHDLCQPLTALQCRLYIGTMEEEGTAMMSAIDDSLVQCERMMNGIRALQDRMEELAADDGGAL